MFPASADYVPLLAVKTFARLLKISIKSLRTMTVSSGTHLTAAAVRERRQSGQPDFQGADLSGLDLCGFDFSGCDLTGADLRSTRLTNANLRAAKLIKARTGTLVGGRIVRCLSILFATLTTACFISLSAAICATVAADQGLYWYLKLGLLLAIVCWLGLIVRWGLSIFSGFLAMAGAMTTAGVVAMAIAGTPTNVIAAAVAGAGVGSIAAAGAVLVAGIGLTAGLGAIAGTVAAALLVAIATPGTFGHRAVVALLASAMGIGLTLVSLALRRRALRGDRRDGWLRNLALWFARLAHTDLSGADLTDADLSGMHLDGVDLKGATFLRTRFLGASGLERARFVQTGLHALPLQRLAVTLDGSGQDLSGLHIASIALAGAKLAKSILRGCELAGVELGGADLKQTDLRGTRLIEARLCGAQFDGAQMNDVDLRGADLSNAALGTAQLAGARVDRLTFEQSKWSADELIAMLERGVNIIGLDKFPEALRARLLSVQEGLTLYFCTRLDRLDRIFVEGIIVSVLGRETECELAEFRNTTAGAVVRLTSPQRGDLEQVADAIYRKVWEEEDQDHATEEEVLQRCSNVGGHELVRIIDLLQSPQLRVGLRSLRERLETLELREAGLALAQQEALIRAVGERGALEAAVPAALCWRLRLSDEERGGNRYEIPRKWRILLHYAPEDTNHASELRKRISPLIREGLAEVFALMPPGTVIAEEQQLRLREANVLVVLVSADYLASDDCDRFLRQAIQYPVAKLWVVPVLIRTAAIDGTPLAGRTALPKNGRAVANWRSQDAAWKDVVDGLRLLLCSHL